MILSPSWPLCTPFPPRSPHPCSLLIMTTATVPVLTEPLLYPALCDLIPFYSVSLSPALHPFFYHPLALFRIQISPFCLKSLASLLPTACLKTLHPHLVASSASPQSVPIWTLPCPALPGFSFCPPSHHSFHLQFSSFPVLMNPFLIQVFLSFSSPASILYPVTSSPS